MAFDLPARASLRLTLVDALAECVNEGVVDGEQACELLKSFSEVFSKCCRQKFQLVGTLMSFKVRKRGRGLKALLVAKDCELIRPNGRMKIDFLRLLVDVPEELRDPPAEQIEVPSRRPREESVVGGRTSLTTFGEHELRFICGRVAANLPPNVNRERLAAYVSQRARDVESKIERLERFCNLPDFAAPKLALQNTSQQYIPHSVAYDVEEEPPETLAKTVTRHARRWIEEGHGMEEVLTTAYGACTGNASDANATRKQLFELHFARLQDNERALRDPNALLEPLRIAFQDNFFHNVLYALPRETGRTRLRVRRSDANSWACDVLINEGYFDEIVSFYKRDDRIALSVEKFTI